MPGSAVPAADRIPVIVGVGQINDRPSNDEEALDSAGLMLAALADAERDARATLLDRLDWLGVEDQISFPEDAIERTVAAGMPRQPRALFRTDQVSGTGPTELLNMAANLVARGEARFAAIVGGEALRTAGRWAQSGFRAVGDGGARLRELSEQATTPLARLYGIATPAEVYPLYENATRAAWGQTLAQAQSESGKIWAGMSAVAAANPAAWLRTETTADEIVTPSPTNRMVSFPYTKLMVANSAVNQGGAVIVASLAAAREAGIDERSMIHIGAGAGAREPEDYLRRDGFDHSASLDATITEVLARNRLSVDAIDMVELYSCFPCVPKMARRVLGWPVEKPATVYGGLTFGGGPIGNCMMHAVAAMVHRLRSTGGTGLVVSNGGYATYNHAIVLTDRPLPAGTFPQDYSVQAQANARRRPVPDLLESYVGPGTIETFAAPYGREGQLRFATIVGRTPDGARFLAVVPGDDAAALDYLTNGIEEPVGSQGDAVPMQDGRSRWVIRGRGAEA